MYFKYILLHFKLHWLFKSSGNVISNDLQAGFYHASLIHCIQPTVLCFLFCLLLMWHVLQVLPGLYVGNFRDAKDPDQLRANNITHIISIHDNAKKVHDVSTLHPGSRNLLSDMPACRISHHIPDWACIFFFRPSRDFFQFIKKNSDY